MSPIDNSSSKDALIVDGSSINGRVLLVFDDNAEIAPTEVVKDAAFFNLAANGNFVYKSRANTWFHGNVTRPESLTAITPVPLGSTYAALSPDGKKVVWLVETAKSSRLVSTTLETEEQHLLVSEAGVIKVPAWSPQSNSIAYYSGPQDAAVTGKFILKMLSLGSASKGGPLTQPSHPTGMTADRTQPPSWSPDGARILFVGNFEKNEVIRAFAYVVHADGTGLKRVEGGVWNSNGTRIWIVRRKEQPFGPLVLATFDLSSGQSQDIDSPVLPMTMGDNKWKRDGRMFAFISEKGEVEVIDVTKKKQIKLIDFDAAAKLAWVE